MTLSGSISKRGYSKALSIGLNCSTDITEYLTVDVNGSSVRAKPCALENPVFWDSPWFGNPIIGNLMNQTIIMNIVDFLAKHVKFQEVAQTSHNPPSPPKKGIIIISAPKFSL